MRSRGGEASVQNAARTSELLLGGRYPRARSRRRGRRVSARGWRCRCGASVVGGVGVCACVGGCCLLNRVGCVAGGTRLGPGPLTACRGTVTGKWCGLSTCPFFLLVPILCVFLFSSWCSACHLILLIMRLMKCEVWCFLYLALENSICVT
jgi:hypothetical protein